MTSTGTRVHRGRRDGDFGRLGTRSQAGVPCREDNRVSTQHQRARKVYGVNPAEGMLSSEISSVLRNGFGHLDYPNRGPEFLPASFRCLEGLPVEPAVSSGSGERSAHLGVRQPAGYSSITAVPELRCELAPLLLDEELRERAAIEVNDGHTITGAARLRVGRRVLATVLVVGQPPWVERHSEDG